MKKIICDLCNNEVKGDGFINQTIIEWDSGESYESDICRVCWDKENVEIAQNKDNTQHTTKPKNSTK